MEKTLYLIHTESDGTLSKVALEGLSAALEVAKGVGGGNLTVGLVGGEIQAAADSIAGSGAKILGVSGKDFLTSRYGSDAAACEALAKKAEATLVLAPTTSRFSRTLPGVTHRLKGRIDTHVSGFKLDGKIEIERWYYRQRILARLTRTQRPWVLIVDSGVYTPWSRGTAGRAGVVENVPVELSDNCKRTEVVGVEAPSADAQTIRPDAEILFVAGAGWTKKQADGKTHVKDAEGLILGFLGKANASLGSSKSLVDQSGEGQEVLSCMSHLNQVGQTGATPRHPKGLSTCCHGEEPHVVGWRFINDRRAINLDANCGWAQGKADVVYVADAFEVISKVNKLLSK